MVEVNAFAQSMVVIRLKVSIQRISRSSVLNYFKAIVLFRFYYHSMFRKLESGMQRVSEELARRYKKCKHQLHLQHPKS